MWGFYNLFFTSSFLLCFCKIGATKRSKQETMVFTHSKRAKALLCHVTYLIVEDTALVRRLSDSGVDYAASSISDSR